MFIVLQGVVILAHSMHGHGSSLVTLAPVWLHVDALLSIFVGFDEVIEVVVGS